MPYDASVGRDVAVEEDPRGGHRPVLGRGRCTSLSASSTRRSRRAATARCPPTPAAATTHHHVAYGPTHATASTGSNGPGAGAGGFWSAAQHPVMRIEMWTAANETLLIVAASRIADQTVDAGRDQHPNGHERGHHRGGLAGPGALLRGHDEGALLAQHGVDRGEHVDPEVRRRQRERGERVGARAGHRCHRQRRRRSRGRSGAGTRERRCRRSADRHPADESPGSSCR